MTKEKKVEMKERATEDIRVSKKVWGFLYAIANEVRVRTGQRSTPNEILTANKQNITTKAVLEMRKREEEEEKSAVVSEEGGKKEERRKSLLEVAIEDTKKREKEEKEDV